MRRKLRIETEYQGWKLEAEFHRKVNVFTYNPEDITKLMECMAHYCEENGISHTLITYSRRTGQNDYDANVIMEKCAGKEVVLLDRTEKYLGRDLLEEIRRGCGMVFLSRNERKLRMLGLRKDHAAFYQVACSDGIFEVEPWDPPLTRAAYIRAYGRK